MDQTANPSKFNRPESDTPPTPPPGVRAGMSAENGHFWQQCRRCSTWWNDCDEDETIGACPVCRPRMLAEYVQQPAWAWVTGQWSVDDRINQRARDAWAVSPTHLSARELRQNVDPVQHLQKVKQATWFPQPVAPAPAQVAVFHG